MVSITIDNGRMLRKLCNVHLMLAKDGSRGQLKCSVGNNDNNSSRIFWIWIIWLVKLQKNIFKTFLREKIASQIVKIYLFLFYVVNNYLIINKAVYQWLIISECRINAEQ